MGDASRVSKLPVPETHLKALGNAVTDVWATAGVKHRAPSPLLQPDGTGLLLTNSAIVPLLQAGWTDLASAPFSVVQPCYRAHNLDLWESGSYSSEWLSAFTMLGAFTGGLELTCRLTAMLVDVADPTGELELLVKASDRDRDLATALCSAVEVNRRPCTVALDEPVPVHQQAWKPKYYDWTFGPSGLEGRGLTFALAQSDGSWRDLGNVIAFGTEGQDVAHGVGVGVETLAAAATSRPHVLNVTTAGADVALGDLGSVALADFLRGIATLVAEGVQPSARGVGNILRRTGRTARVLALGRGLGRAAITTHMEVVCAATSATARPLGDLVHSAVEVIFPSERFEQHTFSFTFAEAEPAPGVIAALRHQVDPDWAIDDVCARPSTDTGGDRSTVDVDVTVAADARRRCHGDLSALVVAVAATNGMPVVGFPR